MVSANDRRSGGGLGVEYASPFRADRSATWSGIGAA